MNSAKPINKTAILIFFMLIAAVSFGNGLSDTILANYFKDAYNVSAMQRAFIEFPRELPGILCVFVISALSFIGDIRIAFIAQVLTCFGIAILGIFSPSFTIMLIFLFIYSLGMHVFMPLSDSIGMSLAEPDKVGIRVGQYGSVKTAFMFLAGILTFFGFRYGWFSFKTPIKLTFIFSAVAYAVAAVLAIMLIVVTKQKKVMYKKASLSFVFKKEYKYYYMLTILHGVQKQIAIVFGQWVIVDLLLKGADIISILTIVGSFLSIFLFRYVGKWIETKGIRFMMFLDGWSFIFVYVIYGIAVMLIVENIVPSHTIMVFIIYVLFILDRLSMQVGVVKSVYLRSIATDKTDVTKALSTGISLDHVMSIIAAQICGLIWQIFGAHWVFFFAAALSLGNIFVARKIK